MGYSDPNVKEHVHISSLAKPHTGFSYYEYKYHVPHESLSYIKHILEEFCGNIDPFPSGIVDSIYYDTRSLECFRQCLNGEAIKYKYRIRGYGDGSYGQIHQKKKDLSSVDKYKCKIQPVQIKGSLFPEWQDLKPLIDQDPTFQKISYSASRIGVLYPSIRVKYYRYRYRSYDYRITLDTNIEISASSNGLPHNQHSVVLPSHVLEIKTTYKRPSLPFIGLIKLNQISFSKFMLGVIELNN
jgi:hypothetical protein